MRFVLGLLLLNCIPAAGLCRGEPAPPPESMRGAFLQAEQLLDRGADAEFLALAPALKSYVLYPYLQYQWHKKHLDDDNAVRDFLRLYESSRYAGLLRNKWLRRLGERRQWPLFAEFYRHADDLDLQCYRASAEYHTGQTEPALENARQIWLSGKPAPAACRDLFALFKTSDLFQSEQIWRRFRAALALDNSEAARELVELLPAAEQAYAGLWLNLHRQPALVREPGDWKTGYALAGPLFAHAINRWLDKEPSLALQTWDAEKTRYAMPADAAAETERKLALALAFHRDGRAYERLARLENPDASAREWRIRAALNSQDWRRVIAAADALTAEERQQDKWLYWRARALAEAGQADMAAGIYRQVAQNRSIYGAFAAARAGQNLNWTNRPVDAALPEIATLGEGYEFRMAEELLAIGRKQEAKGQWRHAIAGLNPHELKAAAKLAEQWRAPALAIATIAKAGDWDDMDLRFPTPYLTQVRAGAQAQQLDPALIFGLIRQESAFDELADSPAGAKGLMQIMPGTARQIAQSLKDDWRGDASLFDPELNIRYGSYFYKNLLARFHGNNLLSAAAYNAGPAKVRQWLPVNGGLPGDIWLETIPYKETRGYAASVLLYTMIYQQRLRANTLKPADIFREIGGD